MCIFVKFARFGNIEFFDDMKIIWRTAVFAMLSVLCIDGMAEDVRPLRVLRTSADRVTVVDGNRKSAINWLMNPAIRPDVYETSARTVTFMSEIDTLSFNVERNGVYDFVVVKNSTDSAFTQIRWVSDNPLEDPPADMLRLSPSGKLTRGQAAFDIDALFYTISEVHPAMFSVCCHDSLMRAVNEVKGSLPDSITRAELYMRLAPLLAMIGDGHTYLVFPFNDVFTADLRRLPVSFVINTSDYTMRVKSCIDGTIPEGAEVTAINGLAVREMLERMMTFVSGERDFFRLSMVNYDFSALFEMLYAADEYEITYRVPGSRKTSAATLAAATWEEISRRLPKKKARSRWQAYSFELMKDKNVAVMDFRSFYDENNMKHFADSMFAAIRENGITNLIIDIRENGGGVSLVGDELLKYISPVPFTQFEKEFVRVTPTTLRLCEDIGTPRIEMYYMEEKDMVKPLTQAEGRFDGHVYLLISHNSFSSAASFAWAFKQFGMGTVIGEETGGMGVSYGDCVNYRLPVSGLSCLISFKRFWHYGADERDIHGVLPDYEVPQAEALDKALKLARKNRK